MLLTRCNVLKAARVNGVQVQSRRLFINLLWLDIFTSSNTC